MSPLVQLVFGMTVLAASTFGHGHRLGRHDCPNGYDLVGDVCLIVVEAKMSYAEARDNCEAMGARLATPKTRALRNSLLAWDKLVQRPNMTIWLGVLNIGDEELKNDVRRSLSENWRNIKHIRRRSIRAALDGPICVGGRVREPQLRLLDCEQKTFKSVCEKPPLECPDGFVMHGQFCYALIDRRLSWEEAAADCTAMGAYLAEPRTLGENTFIKGLAATHKSTGTWTGGNDKVTEGQYYWAGSGDPISGFTDWGPGQPNNYIFQDCIQLYKTDEYEWDDEPCSTTHPFICQKVLEDNVTAR